MADEKVMLGAIATTTVAAGLIGGKWPWYVVALMGTCYGHITGMGNATNLWRTKEAHGLIEELDDLKTEMAAFKKRLKDEGKWEGGAWDTFEDAYDKFRQGVDALAELRNLNGAGVEATQKAFKVLAILFNVVAGVMLAVGIAMVWARLHPAGRVAAVLLSNSAGSTATSTTRASVWKLVKILGIFAGVLYMAIKQTEMTGKFFP